MKKVSPGPAARGMQFARWLAEHSLDGDSRYGASSVRYHVARYCEYLEVNPWSGGDPLQDPAARDGAVGAYRTYLGTFTPDTNVVPILTSLERFYDFLGVGSATRPHAKP